MDQLAIHILSIHITLHALPPMGICKNDGVHCRKTTEVPGKVQFELVNSKHAPSCNERSCRTLLWTSVNLHKIQYIRPPQVVHLFLLLWSISEFLYNEHVQKQCSPEFKGTSVQVFILYFQPTCFKAFTYRAFSSRDQFRILEINRHLGVQLVQYVVSSICDID